MSGAEPCHRYPCDHAYPGLIHRQRREDGRELHVCSAGGSLSDGWEVASVALGDGPWRVAIKLSKDDDWHVLASEDRCRDNTVLRAQDAIESAMSFASSVATAATRAAGTWLHDGRYAEFETGADFWRKP